MLKNYLIFIVVAAVIVVGAVLYKSKTPATPSVEPPADGTLIDDSRHDLGMDQLKIEDVKVGTGAEAVAGKTVTVQYVGTFEDGKKFDASRDHGNDGFTFTLGAGQVIAGWDQGVVGMKVGGVRKLIIPPELGYGMNDYGPIPGGSTLYFEIELLAVK